MHIRKLFFAVFLVTAPVFAQTSINLSSSEIKLGIKKLNTLGRALYIAAHPDDENTRLLAYLAKEKRFRTGYLSLTRGDGGQNLIGNEQAELLGLIRTHELLAARKTDGAEQFFTPAIDFGFSKNPEETFRVWDKEQILADAVWVIRKFRPDIIITRFPEDSRAGHGQHSASAIIAREAFYAAADPKRFPEQLSKVQAWQAKRIVWNHANFGGSTDLLQGIPLNVGAFNPLIGKSYGEIAAESRTNHKSQGFGSARQRGDAMEYFSLIAGEPATNDIFEGINTEWTTISGGPAIAKMLAEADRSFIAEEPHRSLPKLASIGRLISAIPDKYWREQKTKEINDLIIAAAGLWFESYSDKPVSALGDSISGRSQIVLQSSASVKLLSVGGNNPNISLETGRTYSFSSPFKLLKSSEPYWLSLEPMPGMYMIPDDRYIGLAENPPAAEIVYRFQIEDYVFDVSRPLVYKRTDQVRGEVYRPLSVAPPVTISVENRSILFTDDSPKPVTVVLKSFKPSISGTLRPRIPAGWKSVPESIGFLLEKAGDEQAIQFMVSGDQGSPPGVLEFVAKTNSGTFDRGSQTISYDHIPEQMNFPIAKTKLQWIDLKTGGRNVGYVPGAGDLIPESLKQIGFNVTLLSDAQILNSDLSKFDAIVTGVRVYNVNERMSQLQAKLLQYVGNGGSLVVQYNVSNPLYSETLGPYPFRLSRDRVTDETALVTFNAPEHAMLNYPNKISEKDFQGWIQERGLYFTTASDPKYERLLVMNDPGEKPSDGSLLVADYGKGRFVYTSLSFFRQLPAGVPGAYRLFVNLLTKK